MIYVTLGLTIAGICAILYFNYKKQQLRLSDARLQEQEKKTADLKESIKQTQKEIDDAGKDYNNVYDAYNRKYNKSPR